MRWKRVPRGCYTNLLLEARALLEGVVQLGVGVAELLAAHKALETLAQARPRAVPLGERRHHLWMADWRTTDTSGKSGDRDDEQGHGVPMKAGEMQSGSMNSPTSWTAM